MYPYRDLYVLFFLIINSKLGSSEYVPPDVSQIIGRKHTGMKEVAKYLYYGVTY